MSLKDLKDDNYKAKALGGAWGFIGDKKTPAVVVEFEIEVPNTTPVRKEKIFWTGFLTDTMRKDGKTVYQASLEALARCGYDETVPLVEVDAPSGGKMRKFDQRHLEAGREVSLACGWETDNTKTPPVSRFKANFVNELGGSRMEGHSAEEVMGGKNLQAEMAAARARIGAKSPVTPPRAAPTTAAQVSLGNVDTQEDIPF